MIISYDISGQTNQVSEVNSIAELHLAISNAEPGNTLMLEDGIYEGKELVISASGAKDRPIRIQAKNIGKASIYTPLVIRGDYISIIGLKFQQDGQLQIEGHGNRISQCTMKNVNTGKWIRVLPGSSMVEIDYNLFEDKKSNLTMERGCQLMQLVVRNKNEQHHIHHNLFQNIPEGSGNGFETLQLITENNPFDPAPGDCNTIIEDNVFVKCNGESEIISVKSNGNILRRNTFRACKGALVLRHGDDNVVTGNFFFGDGEPGSGGVRIQGTGQVVANNYFHGLQRYGFGMMDGTPDNLYIRVEHAQVLLNTFIDCKNTVQIGLNHSKHPNGTVPKDCLIAGNIFYNNSEQEVTENHDPFVVFVQNDEPKGWLWRDNLAFGNDAQVAFEGLEIKDPKLEFVRDGLGVPTIGTPKMKDPMQVTDLINVDVLGSPRDERSTIGAIQYPADMTQLEIRREHSVGPSSFKENTAG